MQEQLCVTTQIASLCAGLRILPAPDMLGIVGATGGSSDTPDEEQDGDSVCHGSSKAKSAADREVNL